MSDKQPWEDRVIERRKVRIGDIRANKWNPRSHPHVQRERLEATLSKFGMIGELIAFKDDDGEWTLFDGHARQELDPDQEWTVAFTSLTRKEVNELVLLYDPLAALARQEADKTMALMADLEVQERALREMLEEQARGLGFVFGGDGDGRQEPPPPEVDRAEELQKQWQVKPGDIWQIADHYLICGDCREPETWERLLAAAGVDKVNGVFTSPPYAEQRKQQYGGVPTDQYVEWWEAVQGNVREHLAGDGSFFVNIKPHCEDGQRVLYVFDLVLAMVRRWGWRFVDELCWVRKSAPGEWPNRFKNWFEPVYQFALNEIKFRPRNVSMPSDDAILSSRGGGLHNYHDPGNINEKSVRRGHGMAWASNVIETQVSDDGAHGHGASFPLALPDFFIRAYSDPGDVWCDPFVGSGTTIAAAHQNQRRGLGVEVLEKYCAVVLTRLQGLGLAPRLVEQA